MKFRKHIGFLIIDFANSHRTYCLAGTSGLTPGQYISRECDGTGTSPEVQCSDCTMQCPGNDQFTDPGIVCSGYDAYDTRPSQACKPCRKECPISSFVAGRCLGGNRTSDRDTTYCVSCSACRAGEFLRTPCSGYSFGTEDKRCLPCSVSSFPSFNNSCALGSYVLNECASGRDLVDRTRCTSCNRNCKAANFSVGESGQYIKTSCNSSSVVKDNVCGNCDGACARGQFISSFCTGLTTQNRQCMDCRTTCPGM